MDHIAPGDIREVASPASNVGAVSPIQAYEKPTMVTYTPEELATLELACGSSCSGVCCSPSGSGHD